MCMAKTVVCCPKCKTPQQVIRPDSNHPFWTIERPTETEERIISVEQTVECKNSGCHNKFNIYGYNK